MENFMDDVQAISRLKNGDIGGLEVLVDRYQNKAVQTAYLITHDEQLAEDIAQETFIRVFQRIRHFDKTRPFAPYLLRSVANAALNAAEKTARWVQIGAGSDVDRVTELLSEATMVEDQVEYACLKEEIERALGALPPRQRAAIVRRYYLGMKEAEIASSLSAAPGTVKWLLNTARERLRSLLRPDRRAE
jgi:RNA polymerase sigma-70 factor, ECF subfamily